MRPSDGRLQTAEHILSKTLENLFPSAKVVIAVFKNESGRLEIITAADPRQLGAATFEASVNEVISRNLTVKKYFLSRDVALQEFDLARLPPEVQEVRIVEIEGFDRTPCKDPHVENTREIGHFRIMKLERAGKDRYRFIFTVI